MKRSTIHGGSPRPAGGKLRSAVAAGLVIAGLGAACAGGSSSGRASAGSGDTIPQPTDADLAAAGFDELPLAPRSDRVDVAAPTFTDPTNITNPLFPISELHSVVFSGEVEGKPFHTETTLLPQTKIIEWSDGELVETRISQYFAYLDGRIEEVALDYYAQADDGSVWYFGEELWDFNEDGFIDSTEGAWLAGVDGPPAMIMPGEPQVGDVHRAENVPPVAFEEVEVTTIDKTVDGPAGSVEGALVGRELHLDGTYSDKVFAPGYGEFYSAHEGDVEALALAVPTNALDGDVPADLEALSAGADEAFAAVRAGDWDTAAAAFEPVTAAWRTYSGGEVSPYLATEMDRALADLAAAIDARERAQAGTAAIDVAQSAIDLQLRYRPVADIDLARFELWARQLVVDAAEGDLDRMRGDVTTLEFIRDRFVHTLDRPDVIAIDVHLMELRNTVNDGDPAAGEEEADALRETLAGIDGSTGSNDATASASAGSGEGAGRGSRDSAVIDPGDGGNYRPTLDPADFVHPIDNPYLPLRPGARWTYEGVVDGEDTRIELAVTTTHKEILGISAVGVSDTNHIDGELAAETLDWYAQDREGNVWYLGEETKEYENGVLKGTEGSWRAGVDGALPGIFMRAAPTVGDAYRQTYQPGQAEDLARVEQVGATQSIGLGDYRDVVVIQEWTPLEPETMERKYYAPGVGKIHEVITSGGDGGTELVEFTPGR
jgi:hypothetical protein